MNVPLSVLIADDHPIFRKGLCDVIGEDPALRLAGQAGNGEEALRWIGELHPDIAVLDINMPKLSGLQVARSLVERRSPVKLVLLTMHEDEDLFDEAMEIGVKAYVLKESAVEDLLAAVHAVAAGGSFISAPIAGLLVQRREQAAALRREKPGLELLTPSERRSVRARWRRTGRT
jgi:DNA-binding NarL/FixJ family response regulator